jgi:hypothetical protein
MYENALVRVSFEVEQAGCDACGRLIGSALSQLAPVERLEIDEAADRATVVLAGAVSPAAVDAALVEASSDSGHAYRVRVGSWRTGGSGSTAAPA